MICAYYRVSTNKQDFENQKFGVVNYCKRNDWTIDYEVCDDGVSGSVKAKDRKLGKLLKRLKSGDRLIVSELSRLGRSTSDVIETCQELNDNGVFVYFVKQNMILDNSPTGKLMTAIFSAFSELERDLLRQRVKEALDKKKAEGVHLGRKFGFTYRKLNEAQVRKLVRQGLSKGAIAKQLGCSWQTLHRFMKERGISLCVHWKNGFSKNDR